MGASEKIISKDRQNYDKLKKAIDVAASNEKSTGHKLPAPIAAMKALGSSTKSSKPGLGKSLKRNITNKDKAY
jgi:hypothetical protein